MRMRMRGRDLIDKQVNNGIARVAAPRGLSRQSVVLAPEVVHEVDLVWHGGVPAELGATVRVGN